MAAPLPPWAARTVYVGAGAFGALNLVVSATSVGLLAHDHLHLGMVRAVALALGLDCGAVVAAVLWVAAPPGHELRRWGRSVTLGLVTASVVGNASDVLADAGHVPGPALVALALVLAVAAPLVSMLLGHLILLVRASVTVTRHPRQTPAVTPSRTPSPGVTAGTPAPLPGPAVAAVDETPDARRRRLAAERSARYRASRRSDAA